MIVAGAALLPAATAFSQQATPQSTAAQGKPPPRLAFSFSTGVNADTNRNLQFGTPDRTVTLDTNVGLAYSVKTRIESFSASVNTLWQLGTTSPGLQAPTANLAYSFDNGDTRLTASGTYQKSQVSLLQPLTLADGTISPTDLSATSGSVAAWGAKLDLETGMHAPLGFLLSASTDRRDYSNNSDPNVYNSRIDALSTTLRFHVDRLNQVDLTLGTNRQQYENALQTQSQQDQLSLGYTRQLTPTLGFQGQLAYSRNQTDQVLYGFLPVQQKNSGLSGSLGLTQALSDGSASVTLSSQRDSFGVRNALELGRTIVLPTLRLDAQAGVSIRPGQGTQPIGQVSYTTQAPVDNLTAALSRAVTLDANNNDVAATSLSLGYNHKLTPLSSLSLDLNASYSGDGGLGAAPSVDRQSLRATYSYQVTSDWNLDAGYLFRHLNEAGSGSATSNSVFLTLKRNFTLWP